VQGSCERGNEPSGSICEEYLDQLRNYLLLVKNWYENIVLFKLFVFCVKIQSVAMNAQLKRNGG